MQRLILLLLLLPTLLIAEEQPKYSQKKGFPFQAIRTDKFKIKHVYFNKIVPADEGEMLNVDIVIENEIDEPLDLYIFVIASFEKSFIAKSSFVRPSLEDKNGIKLFVPYPNDMENFIYENGKDKKGEKIRFYVKYPKDYKKGVNPKTGKPYRLDVIKKLFLTTHHLTRYKKQFNFFNEAILLIFDKDGKLLYRQQYNLKKVRR